MTPKNQKLFALFTYAEERRDKDPEWAYVTDQLRAMVPIQSDIPSEKYLSFVQMLERGSTVRDACRENHLSYAQVKPALAEINWNCQWRWRDETRKIGQLTIKEIRDAYMAAHGDHGIGAIIATRAGVSRQRIQQVLQALDLSSPYSKAKDHSKIIDMLDAGARIEDIAVEYDASYGAAASLVSRLRRARVAKPNVAELQLQVNRLLNKNEEPVLGT